MSTLYAVVDRTLAWVPEVVDESLHKVKRIGPCNLVSNPILHDNRDRPREHLILIDSQNMQKRVMLNIHHIEFLIPEVLLGLRP